MATRPGATRAAPARREPREPRRALSHLGGPVETWGEDTAARGLAAAFSVSRDDDANLPHVHGFHSYPARLHPLTAARLIAAFSSAHQVVLDPFMGSGTVVVEARLQGRRAVGVDVNPLAVELAWLKCRGANVGERQALIAAAGRIAAHAEERRLTRAGPSRRYGPEDRERYDAHVLLELDGLADGISLERGAFQRRVAGLVLSSIMTKVSRQPGDTSRARETKRQASGATVRLFAAKVNELGARLAEFGSLLPRGAPRARLAQADARRLEGLRDASVDLVVTSPPYPGIYDYVAHHAARLRWLGLDVHGFAQAEIGSRRGYADLDFTEATATWRRELGAALRALGRVLTPEGRAILVIADSVVGRRALRADELLGALAPDVGLVPVARASQLRPHFHEPTRDAFRGRPRREHLLLLRRRTES